MDTLHPEFLNFVKCAKLHNLRYLLIGGYAVNYYGYMRHTQDMDIWIAPTNENRTCFINTMLCMGYSANEVVHLNEEDFTKPFKADIGVVDADIDILTYVHHNISYNDAEKSMEFIEIDKGIIIPVVPYKILIEMKLLTRRDKDINDIQNLEKLRNSKP